MLREQQEKKGMEVSFYLFHFIMNDLEKKLKKLHIDDWANGQNKNLLYTMIRNSF